ncbi:ATP-dependent Clp protease proteolytic subunit [Paenarthrobacter sp. PH39-S1]|uniref:ClpP family protease n=1 Tax=Paenarthrobacter sp. PH39-S1 TaxID=3046204 RepID=UPI0024B88FF6|nr:ATP-dependent Clp protease proteolytic subunit [Paenarthrobacter sp. PH39-S1]MDJ0356636.1 ATP-dependent Clp protease proteolytic subunit [Paenarthrobacter sp. PH39-S1]
MSSYTIPYVTIRSSDGSRQTLDIYSSLLAERIIYLGTPIDDGVANNLIAQLIHLESQSPDTPIDLYINSPGGSIEAMLGIYDAVQYVRSPIRTVCIGQAAFTAAVLLACGAPGQRSILPRGRAVLHQPSVEPGRGTVPDLILDAEEVARVKSLLEEILAQHTGKRIETIRQDTDCNLILNASQAVEYGLVDQVVENRKA